MEATRPVNCIEGGILVDLCKQRSGERGSGCYGPEEILRSPTLADISWRSSGGSSIAVTSSPMPPKPARTGRKTIFLAKSSQEGYMHAYTHN